MSRQKDTKNPAREDREETMPPEAAPPDASASGSEPAAPPEFPPEPTPEEVEAFLQSCAQAVAERDEYKERYLRLAAEYDNYRKRTQRERDALYLDARADTAEKFLAVYDNLERAVTQETGDEAYKRGVEMIFSGFLETLAKMDVTPIEALGKPFDPNWHEAVMHVEDDSGEENTVAEVFQTGFAMGERVLRPAMVKVKN